jgi:hypothetical protein
VYGATIVILIVVLIDSKVFWFESLLMIAASVGYTVIMYYNVSIEKWASGLHEKYFGRSTSGTYLHLYLLWLGWIRLG